MGNRASRVAPGLRFGKLTVVQSIGHRAEPSGHRRLWFLARCDCGADYEVCGNYLLRGDSKSCRKCAHIAQRVAKPGDRFDRLVVVDYELVDSRVMAKCTCDCGNVVHVRPNCLKSNMTNNCGCAARGGWKGAGELSGSHFNHIRHGAKVRGLEFSVTIEQLWERFEAQGRRCALTGLPIRFVTTRNRSPETTASCDRIDGRIGYIVGNVQWVHKDVNLMKMDLEEPRFIELCALVASHSARRAVAA